MILVYFLPGLRQDDATDGIGHADIGVTQGKLHQLVTGVRHLNVVRRTS